MLSVIVPNYNHSKELPQTLGSLAEQTVGASSFEVVLVDDGSIDGSVETVEGLRASLPYALSLIQQNRGGPAAARNRGARAARNDLLVFWDSDMLAEPRLLQEHAALHEQHARALVAGAVRHWAPACTSSFDRIVKLPHIEEDQIDVTRRVSHRPPGFQEALSSNLSLVRKDLDDLRGFDESLRAFEDIDLAYRACRSGMRLILSPQAIGYHNHPETLAQACAHQQYYQSYAACFLAKHPELQGQITHLRDKAPVHCGQDPPPLVARKIARRLVATRVMLGLLKGCVPLLERFYPNPGVLSSLYWKIVASYQLLGYREGLAKMAGG